MTDSCSHSKCTPSSLLDADSLMLLAVLMAVDGRPLGRQAIARQVWNLAAPGFDSREDTVAAALSRLESGGHVETDRQDAAAEAAWRITEAGRELVGELGARAPGQACDATRTCLLLRLCLDGTMPAQNRRVLVASLLQPGGDGASGDVSANR